MKKFLINFILISFIMFMLVAILFSLADGKTDPFYLRFTSEKQNNLILGNSRAAQGIMPSVLDSILDKKFFNYSFTIAHSSYGPTYLESIGKKLNSKEQKGVYVITVDPWSISSTGKNPNDPRGFKEKFLCLGKTEYVNIDPNYHYIYENFKGEYYKLLLENEFIELHDNGWLELSVDMGYNSVQKRQANKIDLYRKQYLPNYKFSEVRLEYLRKTINLLNKHGKVYLVRLPVSSEIQDIEDDLMPDFESKVSILFPLVEGYLDMTGYNDQFIYIDGNHLFKNSGRKVTEIIGEWISDKEYKIH